MKIAVTGATGHVGLNLVEQLILDGHQVRAFAQSGLELLNGQPVERLQGDVRDEVALARCYDAVDTVYHLAAVISIIGDRGGLVQEVNVGGARASANAALRAGVGRFVHFSSIHAFDIQATDGVIDESSPRATGPHTAAYDRSKALGDVEVRDAIGRGLDAVILHPTGIVGPVDLGPSRAGKGLLDAARGRMPVAVDGAFDWIDVADVVSGARAAAERGQRGSSYIFSGARHSMEELVTWAAERANVSPPLVTLPLRLVASFASVPTLVGRILGREPWFTAESLATLAAPARFSNARAADELGFQPGPIRDTISNLVDWFIASDQLKRRRADMPSLGEGSLASAFVRQLRAHPIDGAAERQILGRTLANIATADRTVDEAERALLRRLGGVDPDEVAIGNELETSDLERLSPGQRDSLLLVATIMACVDEDYSVIERDAIESLRRQLGISASRADTLADWAKDFILDQRFAEFYADGVIDAGERKRIEQIATGLGISRPEMDRLEERARQRHGR